MGKKSNNLLRQLNEDAEMVNRRIEETIDIRECGKKMSRIEEEIGIDIGMIAKEQEK